MTEVVADPSSAAAPAAGWVVVVPVKPPGRGKTRLAVADPTDRARLASAFALDTVTAALGAAGVGEVLAVTDDARFAAVLAGRGCTVLPDGAGGDLNAVLVQAALEAVRRRPGAAVAALCADLPALRADDLAAALAAVPADRPAFVADAAGTGTTLYAARRPGCFRPAFGPGSAAAHRAAGAIPLDGAWSSLRSDVDEPADLRRVLRLGVGPHTRAAAG